MNQVTINEWSLDHVEVRWKTLILFLLNGILPRHPFKFVLLELCKLNAHGLSIIFHL